MRLAVLALAALAVAAPAAAEAPSRLDRVIEAKQLRIGTTGDYKPFSWWNDESKSFEGIDIELARSLAKALGVEPVFVKTSWPTLMQDFEAGKFDIGMGGISVSLERQRRAYFSTAYLRDGKAAVARCENTARFGDLAAIDKAGTKVVVNPGGTNEKFDRATLKSAEIVVYPDNRTIWKEVLEGRADLMITDATETRLWQKEHPGLCAVNPDKPFNFSEKAFLLPRDDVTWKLFVDQWLRQAVESGDVAQTIDKWLD